MRDAGVEVAAGLHQLLPGGLVGDELVDSLQRLVPGADLLLRQLPCSRSRRAVTQLLLVQTHSAREVLVVYRYKGAAD